MTRFTLTDITFNPPDTPVRFELTLLLPHLENNPPSAELIDDALRALAALSAIHSYSDVPAAYPIVRVAVVKEDWRR